MRKVINRKKNDWEELRAYNRMWSHVQHFDVFIFQIWEDVGKQQEILNRTTAILTFIKLRYNAVAYRLEPTKRWV